MNSGTLTIVNFTGQTSIPSVPLRLDRRIGAVPRRSRIDHDPGRVLGVTGVWWSRTHPITIHGTPAARSWRRCRDRNQRWPVRNLQWRQRDFIIDPTNIDLGDDGSTTNTDLVTVTFADTPYSTMRAGTESVVASGSGTIFGGPKSDLINMTGAGASRYLEPRRRRRRR